MRHCLQSIQVASKRYVKTMANIQRRQNSYLDGFLLARKSDLEWAMLYKKSVVIVIGNQSCGSYPITLYYDYLAYLL